MTDAWGADCPISMPVPPKGAVWVNFDGFGFTKFGVAHHMTDTELEELLTPTFGPSDYIPGDER